MNKREAKVMAYKYVAQAIDEFVGDGSLDMHNEFESVSDQDKVEKEMYSIADALRARGERLDGDDGDE